jgi:hypothetical protein
MMIGNLWTVTERAIVDITIRTLRKLLPATQEMVEDARVPLRSHLTRRKFEPDLLFNRSCNAINNYMATAGLVARGLPVVLKVDKNMAAQH